MRPVLMMALPVLLAAGCSGSASDPGEGGVTRAEADALDEAAEKLDRQMPPTKLDSTAEPAK